MYSFIAFTLMIVAKTALHDRTEHIYNAMLRRYYTLSVWVISKFNAVCQRLGLVEIDYTAEIQLDSYRIQQWIKGCKHEWQLTTCEKAIDNFIIDKYPLAQCQKYANQLFTEILIKKALITQNDKETII